jgi:hypothetical protein
MRQKSLSPAHDNKDAAMTDNTLTISLEDFAQALEKRVSERWTHVGGEQNEDGTISATVSLVVRFGDFEATRHWYFFIDPVHKQPGQEGDMVARSSTRWKVVAFNVDAFVFADAGLDTPKAAHKKAASLLSAACPRLYDDAADRKEHVRWMFEKTAFYVNEEAIPQPAKPTATPRKRL